MATVSSILLGVLSNPGDFAAFAAELEAEFAAIKNGEGGVQKVQKAIAGASQILVSASKVLVDLGVESAPAAPPPAPPAA